MRSLLLLACLLVPGLLWAQDDPAPEKPAQEESQPEAQPVTRVSVAAQASLNGELRKPNNFQYFLWERLNYFGFRVDSQNPIHQPKLSAYVDKSAKRWAEREPDAAPASLLIEATQECKYEASIFYGEVQAHNFKGDLQGTLKNSAGETLASFAFDLSWGKPISAKLSKSQVGRRYDQMAQTSMVMLLLTHEALASTLPPDKQEQLQKWVAKEQASILKVLNKSALKKGKLAAILRGLGEDGASEEQGD